MSTPLMFGQAPVPWNASWTGEERYEIRPCRWAGGRLAVWQPFAPGAGRPVFAKPHVVRQRRSIAQMLCTVCGEPTPVGDRWWFALGETVAGNFMTTEAPLHHACAVFAAQVCPHLRRLGAELSPLPPGYAVAMTLVGGSKTDEDFGVRVAGREVVGSLKLAWPKGRIQVLPPQGNPGENR